MLKYCLAFGLGFCAAMITVDIFGPPRIASGGTGGSATAIGKDSVAIGGQGGDWGGAGGVAYGTDGGAVMLWNGGSGGAKVGGKEGYGIISICGAPVMRGQKFGCGGAWGGWTFDGERMFRQASGGDMLVEVKGWFDKDDYWHEGVKPGKSSTTISKPRVP